MVAEAKVHIMKKKCILKSSRSCHIFM